MKGIVMGYRIRIPKHKFAISLEKKQAENDGFFQVWNLGVHF